MRRYVPGNPTVHIYDVESGEWIGTTDLFPSVDEAVAAWAASKRRPLRGSVARRPEFVAAQTTKRTVRGTTFRRRFLLVRYGGKLAWIEAGANSEFGGFVDAPGNDAQHIVPPLPASAVIAAFNAYVARRGSAW